MQNIYVILVEPIYKGNVGSVARIMHNFECYNLRIVGTMPTKEDFVMGAHSEEILSQAQIFESLAEAIKDMDRVIALSRRVGSKKQIDLYPWELGEYVGVRSSVLGIRETNVVHEIEIDKLLSPSTSYRSEEESTLLDNSNPENRKPKTENRNIALVFGRETFGLTDEEADLCDLRCHIPANKAFPSLNLAQAVTVVLYEIYKASLCEPCIDAPLCKGGRGGDTSENLQQKFSKEDTASLVSTNKPEINSSLAFALETLESLNIFRGDDDKKDISNFLHSLMYRSNATKQMTTDLKKLFNRIHLAFHGKGKGY